MKRATLQPAVSVGAANVILARMDTVVTPRKVLKFCADSLTQGASGRVPSVFDGRTWWQTNAITGIGGGVTWLVYAKCDSRVPAGAGGTSPLETDGAGAMRFTAFGDAAGAGAWVDCSIGGWHLLTSGGGASVGQCLVVTRGATAPPVASVGAVSPSGSQYALNEWDFLGYGTWAAGALGDTFSDYQMWGVSGGNAADFAKFALQIVATDTEAVVVQVGNNDNPTTGAQAQAVVASIIAGLEILRGKARRIFVVDVLPDTSRAATNNQYMLLVSTLVRDYCRATPGLVFVPTFDVMVDPTASTLTQKTGAFHTNQQDLKPYGGYLLGTAIAREILKYYPRVDIRKSNIDTFDATTLKGALNTNSQFRGTTGTGSGANGITGGVPTSWAAARTGTTPTQTCDFSFVAPVATDPGGVDGLSWLKIAVAGAGNGSDSNTLTRSIAVPASLQSLATAGTAVYLRQVCEIKVFAMVGTGLDKCQLSIAGTNQNDSLFYENRNLATFTTEEPVLQLVGEPILLKAGTTSFFTTLQIAAGASGAGSGAIGIRNYRLEPVAGPAYP